MHLTNLPSSKVKLKWTEIKQKVFKEIKRIVDRNILLAHTDFSKEFKIYTNARSLQLEAIIIW